MSIGLSFKILLFSKCLLYMPYLKIKSVPIVVELPMLTGPPQTVAEASDMGLPPPHKTDLVRVLF